MTLILSIVKPGLVVQASDRLLTQGSLGPYDTMANKTIVYRANDALASISYSGIAYIDGRPTDQWIAEVLWGEALKDDFGFQMRARPNDWTFAQTIGGLRLAMNRLAVRDLGGVGLFIAAAGLQHDDKLTKPVYAELERKPKDAETSIESGSINYKNISKMIIGKLGANISWDTIDAALAPLREEARSTARSVGFEDVEAILIRLVREIAQQNNTVGPHVLTVGLTPPSAGHSRCRFHPTVPHMARIAKMDGTEGQDFIAAHSPWIIGRHQVAKPGIFNGRWEHVLDDVTVVTEGPSGMPGFFGSSDRKPPPRR